MVDNRLNTKRYNPPERRKMPVLPKADCEKTCGVAIKNHEQIVTAFKRLDEERESNLKTCDLINDSVKELYTSISDLKENELAELRSEISNRVRFFVFTWVIGILILIYSALLGILWESLREERRLSAQIIKEVNATAQGNFRRVEVIVTRLDDFISSYKTEARRAQNDQDRMLRKLEAINNNLKKVEIDISKGK